MIESEHFSTDGRILKPSPPKNELKSLSQVKADQSSPTKLASVQTKETGNADGIRTAEYKTERKTIVGLLPDDANNQ